MRRFITSKIEHSNPAICKVDKTQNQHSPNMENTVQSLKGTDWKEDFSKRYALVGKTC
jgi:hypothetical protein